MRLLDAFQRQSQSLTAATAAAAAAAAVMAVWGEKREVKIPLVSTASKSQKAGFTTGNRLECFWIEIRDDDVFGRTVKCAL
jgi:hypothetical protein